MYMSKKKIAVIGDQSSVLGFKALGIEVFTPKNPKEVKERIETLASEGYGVIFITEQLALDVQDTIAQYDEQYIPAIIPIPSNQGSLSLGMKRIDQHMEKAIGTNIL